MYRNVMIFYACMGYDLVDLRVELMYFFVYGSLRTVVTTRELTAALVRLLRCSCSTLPLDLVPLALALDSTRL